MKKKLKFCTGALSALCAAIVLSVNAFADDFEFDMAKAKQTYGGGQSFVTYTRLDNEKRDAHKFNPLWITEDSLVSVSYDMIEQVSDIPLQLVFQSWSGELVDSTEEKWILIDPSYVEENTAYFTYEDITKVYGNDFSDVYSLVITDASNSMKVTSFKITNCDIPMEEIPELKGGYVYRDGVLLDGTEEQITSSEETSIKETEPSEETVEQTTETVATTQKEEIEEGAPVTNTEINSDTDTEKTTIEKDSENDTESPNLIFIIVIAVVVVVIIIVIICAIISSKKKNKQRAYHKFK